MEFQDGNNFTCQRVRREKTLWWRFRSFGVQDNRLVNGRIQLGDFRGWIISIKEGIGYDVTLHKKIDGDIGDERAPVISTWDRFSFSIPGFLLVEKWKREKQGLPISINSTVSTSGNAVFW